MSVSDGAVAVQSSKDLRYSLGEMVLASIGHKSLLHRLDSMRKQKEILLHLDKLPPPTLPKVHISLSSLVFMGMTIVRLSKKRRGTGLYQSTTLANTVTTPSRKLWLSSPYRTSRTPTDEKPKQKSASLIKTTPRRIQPK